MKLKNKLKYLENINEHSLYAYELAKFVGEKCLSNKFLCINKINNKKGYLPARLANWRYKQVIKLKEKYPILNSLIAL